MSDDKKNVRDIGMSPKAAAAYLGISVNTLRAWSDQGHIRCRRTPGNQRRYESKDLEKFIDNLDKGADDPR